MQTDLFNNHKSDQEGNKLRTHRKFKSTTKCEPISNYSKIPKQENTSQKLEPVLITFTLKQEDTTIPIKFH